MHKCSTPHKGKTHRRRNRFLKMTLDPLNWWNHPKRKFYWGADSAHESAIIDPATNKPAKVRKDGTINSGTGNQKPETSKSKKDRLIETAPASALSWMKKKIPLFRRRSG